MKSAPSPQAGFTLLESLITLAIVGIGLAGAARLQAEVVASMLEARSRVEALQLASQQQERVRTRHLYRAATRTSPPRTITGNLAQYQLSRSSTPSKISGLTTEQVAIDWQLPSRHEYLTLTSQLPDPAHLAQIHRLN